MGGCLGRFWKNWENISKDPWVTQVLKEGYQIPFKELPVLSKLPVKFHSHRPGSPQFVALEAEIQAMLEKGAIEVVPQPMTAGYYARMFVVPKGDRALEWRPIIDLTRLNRHIDTTTFKMETPRSVMQAVRPGDYFISLDLQDAYFQVPIHPHSSRYLRFVWKQKTYQFRAMCFGLSTAPQVFTRICAVVASWLHSKGIRLVRYLDDWLLLASSREAFIEQCQILLSMCSHLGLRVNFRKSSLIPAQQVVYLGMRICSTQFKAFPKEERTAKLIKVASRFLKGNPTFKQFEVLLGLMASLIDLVRGAQTRMRPLQFLLQSARSQGWEEQERMYLDQECIEAVKWWLAPFRLERGVSMRLPSPTIQMETDASVTGWGCRVGTHLLSGTWSQEESLLHINILELRAMFCGLKGSQEILRGKTVALLGDNTTALAYIAHGGGTKSWDCFKEARKVILLAESLDCCLMPRFIQGEKNVVADTLSRAEKAPNTEWSLNGKVCRRLWSLWGTPQVDAFATSLNKKLPRYFSPVPEKEAIGTDAFLQSWDGLDLYMYPPIKLLRRVITKLLQSKNARATLIAPCWPQQAWFPDLMFLLSEVPRRLPPWKDLLENSVLGGECLRPGTLNLHGWRLSTISLERRRYLGRLRPTSPDATEPPPLGYTSQSGKSMLIGVSGGKYIHSDPLFQD